MIYPEQGSQSNNQKNQNKDSLNTLSNPVQNEDNNFTQPNQHKAQQNQENNSLPEIEKNKYLYEIEQDKEYFSIRFDDHSHSCVKGNCSSMISKKQLQQRGYDQFEKHPFQPVAKYIRNKSYDNPQEVRTVQALDQSLTYLKTNFFVSILNDEKKIKKIVFGKVKKQNIEDEKEMKVRQKRLLKILNIIQTQSDLQLIQQETINSLIKRGKVIINDKLQRKLAQNESNDDKKYLFLPQKILVYLQSRLSAIRCELFAQGVIFPRLTMDLLKCQLFLNTLKQNQYTNIGEDLNSYQELKLIGLDVILDRNIKDTLLSRQDFSHHYKEALIIAIFRTNKRDLIKLIEQHQMILENQELLSLFKLRLDIERGNYQKYFKTLSTSQSILVQCLLLTHLKQMRHQLCQVLKSAKIDVKKGWLAVLMGFKIKTEEMNEIINLSKNKQYINEKYEKKEIESRQKQLKNWLKIQDLFYQLILNPQQLQQKSITSKKLSIERDTN